MKFFVYNLATKLLLLGILSTPMTLYALSELKQVQTGGEVKVPPAGSTDAELRTIEDQAAKFYAMPADLRKELMFPMGSPPNEKPPETEYVSLAEVVRYRAQVLHGHRSFLEQLADLKKLANDPNSFVYTGPEKAKLKPIYVMIVHDRSKYFLELLDIQDLRKELPLADFEKFIVLKKKLEDKLKEFSKRWENDRNIATIRDELARRELELEHEQFEYDCKAKERAFQAMIGQALTAGQLESMAADIRTLYKRLQGHELKAGAQANKKQLEFVREQLALWGDRLNLLPRLGDSVRLIDMIKTGKKPVNDVRVSEFLDDCVRIRRSPPAADARRMVRGVVEEFCKAYLKPELQTPELKFDKEVLLIGKDNKPEARPRDTVTVRHSITEIGIPLTDMFTECHAGEDKENPYTKVNGYVDGEHKRLIANFTNIDFTNLRPTPRTEAVFCYKTYFKNMTRWDDSTLTDFYHACEKKHGNELGDTWTRLKTLAEAFKEEKSRELFSFESR